MRQRLEPVHKRLSTVIIENLDWKNCLDRYDRPKTVMYVDPPYPDNGCNYAHNMRSWDDHWQLADCLNAAKCKWILSSYDMPEIRSLYPEAYIIPVQSFSGMKAKKNGSERVLNKEVLITNFLPPNNNSGEPIQIRLLELGEDYRI